MSSIEPPMAQSSTNTTPSSNRKYGDEKRSKEEETKLL